MSKAQRIKRGFSLLNFLNPIAWIKYVKALNKAIFLCDRALRDLQAERVSYMQLVKYQKQQLERIDKLRYTRGRCKLCGQKKK